jgi:hypothetical protein
VRGTPPVFLNVVIARNGARHFVAIQENKDLFNWIATLQLTLSLAMTVCGALPPHVFCYLLKFIGIPNGYNIEKNASTKGEIYEDLEIFTETNRIAASASFSS